MSIIINSEERINTGYLPSAPIARGEMTYDKVLALRTERVGKALEELPRRFSREKQVLRSQDIVGACVGFAVANAVEADAVTYGDKTPVSPIYIYAGCKEIDKTGQEGTTYEYARQSLKQFGACDEAVYPFDPSNRKLMEDFKNLKFPTRTKEILANGKKRKVKDMYKVPMTVNDIKRAIYEENSVLLGFVVTDAFMMHTNGCIGSLMGRILGGHAVDCCSWDDDIELTYDSRPIFGPEKGKVRKYKGGFRFENHWVEEEDANGNPIKWWGDEGYGWLPYELLNFKTPDFGMRLVTEAWTVVMDHGTATVDEEYHQKVSEEQFGGEVLPIRNRIDISIELGTDNAIVNGIPMDMDTSSVIVNDWSLVPLRFISEVFGAEVDYDQPSHTAHIKLASNKRAIVIDMPIGKNYAYINGKKLEMQVASTISNGYTIVPTRFISEVFGAEVGYIQPTHTATISIDEKMLRAAFDKWN